MKYRILIYIGICLFLVNYNTSMFQKVNRNGELDAYRDLIFHLSNGRLGKASTTLGFGKVSEGFKPGFNIVGQCERVPYLYSRITISPTSWEFFEFREKLILVSHEFLHCDCATKHTEEIHGDGCPMSIMFPSIPNEICIDRYWEDYVNEISTGCIK